MTMCMSEIDERSPRWRTGQHNLESENSQGSFTRCRLDSQLNCPDQEFLVVVLRETIRITARIVEPRE